jgi:FkbM family methyltransferase
VDDTHVLSVTLVTLGDPHILTGGYLYHRRMAALAVDNGARVDFVSVPDVVFPLGAAAGFAVLRRIARQHPDVLLLDSIAAAFLAPWLPLRRPRVPVVGMLHQPPGGIDHGRVRTSMQAVLDRAAYRSTARLLVASTALADELAAAGFPRTRLRVVPPGRDVAPAPAGVPADVRRGRRAAFLSVGNWIARKGLLDLLEALSRLPDEAVTLHLVGDTESDTAYAAAVRNRLAAPDLAMRVVVHGPLPTEQVAALYGATDGFVLASSREPYGTVYGEAMAAGRPVIGYDAGNLPHLARDGTEGLVVPPGNVEALAAALRQLADDEALRIRLGQAARRRAAGFPTWQESAALLFGELHDVASRKLERLPVRSRNSRGSDAAPTSGARRLVGSAAGRGARAIVRRLPPGVADVLRGPVSEHGVPSPAGPARLMVLRGLCERGIPDAVRTFRLADRPHLSFVAADSLVLSQLYWLGEQGWEPELVPWWRYFCRQSHGVLELGANVGYFSVQGGRTVTSARYVAVEPHPVSREVCRSNLDLNAITSVQLIGAAAVSDSSVSSIQLLVPADQHALPTVAFLAADSELPQGMGQEKVVAIDVPAVDVRSLLDGVDVLKLDVEGQEHALLAAARPHLRARHPTIFVEVLPGTRRLRSLLAELCEQDGYRCYAATKARLEPLPPARLSAVRLKEEYGCQDVILSVANLPRTTAELDD